MYRYEKDKVDISPFVNLFLGLIGNSKVTDHMSRYEMEKNAALAKELRLLLTSALSEIAEMRERVG